MDKRKNVTLGIDIGGSHITAGLVNLDDRMVINESIIRHRVNRNGTADEILTEWCNAIKTQQLKYVNSFIQIGFAMPGPFDYENGICLIKGFDKYESLYGLNIRAALARRLSLQPFDILFRNDAEAFLEGELFCGAATGFNHAICITLGTGLGSAVSHDGHTKDAELSVLSYQGEKIEEWVSTRGLIRIYKELTGKTVEDALAIAELYNTDADAKETFKIFAHHLSWFLQKFIKQESPEVLVIGGNISNSCKLFMDDLLRNLSLTNVPLPKICRATLGENAALIGGACKFVSFQNKTSFVTL
ncbi:MAG: ROK family protein [Rhizobacter sp.]|nr:ROK family protein [Ferruginibacter sp.]